MIDKLLRVILEDIGYFKGKTVDMMSEDEKIEALGFIIRTAYQDSQKKPRPPLGGGSLGPTRFGR